MNPLSTVCYFCTLNKEGGKTNRTTTIVIRNLLSIHKGAQYPIKNVFLMETDMNH